MRPYDLYLRTGNGNTNTTATDKRIRLTCPQPDVERASTFLFLRGDTLSDTHGGRSGKNGSPNVGMRPATHPPAGRKGRHWRPPSRSGAYEHYTNTGGLGIQIAVPILIKANLG